MTGFDLPQGTPDAVPAAQPSGINDKNYIPRPLKEGTFTGMLNTSDARLEHNYRFAPLSEFGPTNAAPQGKLYKERLAAQIELNHAPEEQHAGHQWNKRREEAIARGEDPNSKMLYEMEHRKPDSYLERAWRKVSGKKATVAEEREHQEAKKRAKREREGDEGMVQISEGVKGKNFGDDGVVR